MPQCICVASAKRKKNLKAVQLFMNFNITQHFLKTEKSAWPLVRAPHNGSQADDRPG